MKKILVFTLITFCSTLTLAKDPVLHLKQLLNDYHTQITTASIENNSEQLHKFITGATAPFAVIYEPNELWRWLLFNKCYYEWDADTLGATIDLDVDYRPIDDYFSVIPAYFTLATRRSSETLDSYKNMMITVFKSVGTGTVVLINKTDNRYGYPGYEYCQSFIYSTTKMVLHCNFLLIENVACAVYYLTGESFYNNSLYKISLELVLIALDFKPFTTVQITKQASPLSFSMSQNYPNPFNSMTKIAYSVERPSVITLEIFDVRGALVKTIVHDYHAKGKYSSVVNAEEFSSGVYLYRLSNGVDYQTQRMVVIK
jgi:hypothetical protein